MPNFQGVDDPRKEVRFKTDLPAVITAENGEVMPGKINNISNSGVQITLGMSCVKDLLPNNPASLSSDNYFDSAVYLEFEIPTVESAEHRVSISCQVLYLRRVTISQCIIGCLFKQLPEETASALSSYLTNFCTPL